jgi:AcrR family transcriptional regulator
MEEIAQRAEFAVGTIYKFFPGKGDLYAETILRGFRQRETQVYETLSSSDSPKERIERYLQCRLSQFWENPNFFRLFFQGLDRVNGDLQAGILADLTTRYRKLKERLRQIFAEGIRQGQFQNYDPGVLTVALEGLIRGYVIQLTLQVNPSRDGDQERQLAQLFLHGAAGLSNSSKGVY